MPISMGAKMEMLKNENKSLRIANSDMRGLIELLEKDKEDLFDELEDINCLGVLAKLLREHGRG